MLLWITQLVLKLRKGRARCLFFVEVFALVNSLIAINSIISYQASSPWLQLANAKLFEQMMPFQ